MSSVNFFRVLKNGLTNFWRNLWLSGAATLVMIITLVILSILLILFTLTKYSINSIQQRVDISAYVKIGLPEQQILNAKSELEQNPKVKEVVYVSAEQAFQDFKAKHQNDPLITESLNELDANPLPATLQIKANDLSDYSDIAAELNSDKYSNVIEKVNFEDNRAVIERLSQILRFIITFGLILTGIFGLIAILVIFNTITLTIYNRKEEIEIMRLVGATNWYIRGPFLVEALTYSLVATIVTASLMIPIYAKVIPKINEYLNVSSETFSNTVLGFVGLIALQLLVSIALSTISTLLATRKYLKT